MRAAPHKLTGTKGATLRLRARWLRQPAGGGTRVPVNLADEGWVPHLQVRSTRDEVLLTLTTGAPVNDCTLVIDADEYVLATLGPDTTAELPTQTRFGLQLKQSGGDVVALLTGGIYLDEDVVAGA